MPNVRIPIVGNYYKRGPQNQELTVTQGKDRRFINTVFTVDGENIYAEKRPGFVQYLGLGTTSSFAGLILASQVTTSNTECLYNVNNAGTVNFIGETSFSCGAIATITGSFSASQQDFVGLIETIISSKTYAVFTYNRSVFYPSENGIFYHPFDATVTSVTGNRTAGSPIISAIASTTGLYSGQLISATGFTAAARILTVDSATQITINENASSGAATATVVTVERLAKVIDVDLPADIVGNCAALDGYLFVMTSGGRIYNSDLNSVSSWSASNYITANTNPDKGVGLIKSKNLIVAFGRGSIEFFYNAGNPSGSPLSRVEASTILLGCTNPNTIISDGDDIYFVGANNGVFAGFDPIGVYILRDRQVRKISIPSVDMVLTGAGYVDNLQIFRAFGKKFVIVNFTDGKNPHIYDIDTGIWCEWQLGTSADVSSFRVCAGGSMVFSGSYRSFMPDGKNVNFTETFQDSTSKTYTFTAQSEAKDFDTGNLKTVEYVELIGDKQSSGTATLEYSDDEYDSWVTAGTFDMTAKNPRIYRVGSFRGKRAWRITHSANTRFRCNALGVEYKVGAH